MLSGLTSKLLWPVAAVVVAVIGAVTYLAQNGTIPGSDVTTIFVLILGGLGITTGAHVAGNLVSSAVAPAPTPVPAPVPLPAVPGGATNSQVGQSAMPVGP